MGILTYIKDATPAPAIFAQAQSSGLQLHALVRE
jgi:hypothetical protein